MTYIEPKLLFRFGDNYCDDDNNNEECGWDGGDCCGDNVNTQYCSACECLDPNAGGSTPAPPPPVTTEGPSDACGSPQWFVIFLNILKYNLPNYDLYIA